MIPMLPGPAATKLLLIRTALLAGLLVFGGVTWYMRRQPDALVLPPERARLYGYVFVAMAAAALTALFVLRRRLQAPGGLTEMAAVQTYIIGYAIAEGTALFGGVTWFLGGSQQWYVAGILLMVASFQVLPVRR
jgi:hypothetical protein